MTDKEIKFKCTKDCKKKNTSECYELNCIEGQTNVLEQLSRKTAECEKYEQALDEILEITQNSDVAPCLEDDANCTNCDDEVTDNGTRCMQYGLYKIKDIISKAKDGK